MHSSRSTIRHSSLRSDEYVKPKSWLDRITMKLGIALSDTDRFDSNACLSGYLGTNPNTNVDRLSWGWFKPRVTGTQTTINRRSLNCCTVVSVVGFIPESSLISVLALAYLYAIDKNIILKETQSPGHQSPWFNPWRANSFKKLCLSKVVTNQLTLNQPNKHIDYTHYDNKRDLRNGPTETVRRVLQAHHSISVD